MGWGDLHPTEMSQTQASPPAWLAIAETAAAHRIGRGFELDRHIDGLSCCEGFAQRAPGGQHVRRPEPMISTYINIDTHRIHRQVGVVDRGGPTIMAMVGPWCRGWGQQQDVVLAVSGSACAAAAVPPQQTSPPWSASPPSSSWGLVPNVSESASTV